MRRFAIGCALLAGCGNPEPEYLKFESRISNEVGRLEATGQLDEAAARLGLILNRYDGLSEKLREKHQASALSYRRRIQELRERSASRRPREDRLRQVREQADRLRTHEEIAAFLARLPAADEADLKEAVDDLRRRLEELRPRRWSDFVARFDEALRQERFRDAAKNLEEARRAIQDPDELRRVEAARAQLEPHAREALRRMESRCKRHKVDQGLDAARAGFDRERFGGVLDARLLDESWERVARFE